MEKWKGLETNDKKEENGNQNLLDLIYPLQLFLAEKNAETDERLQGRTGCNESKL